MTRINLGLLVISQVALLAALSCKDDDEGGTPQASSVSHWVTCDRVLDCDGYDLATSCVDGYCVDAEGERIEPMSNGSSGGATDENEASDSGATDDPVNQGSDDPVASGDEGSGDDDAVADDSNPDDGGTDDGAPGDDPNSADSNPDDAADDGAQGADDAAAGDDDSMTADPSTTDPGEATDDASVGTSGTDDGGVIAAPPGDPCEVETYQGCTVDSECALLTLEDCCGTDFIFGFAESRSDGFDVLMTQCEDWSNADMCECLTELTTTEDGLESTLEQAGVRCDEGLCKSYAAEAPVAPAPPAAAGCESECGAYEVCAMVAAGGPGLSPVCVPWEPCRAAGLCDCIVDTGTCTPRTVDDQSVCECDIGAN
jgi:hypothetical protein